MLTNSGSKSGQFISPGGFGFSVPNPFDFSSNQLKASYGSVHAAAIGLTNASGTYALNLPANATLDLAQLFVKTAYNGTTPTIQISSFDPNLSAPATPTVTVSGAAGSSTWSYEIVALAPDSALLGAYENNAAYQFGWSLASAAGSTTTGNATLGGSNYNTVSWSAYSNAVKYAVYRTAAPTGVALGLIGYTTTTSFVDNGSQFVYSGPNNTVANAFVPAAAGDIMPTSGSNSFPTADLSAVGNYIAAPKQIHSQSPFFNAAGVPLGVQQVYITVAGGVSTAGAADLVLLFHLGVSYASSPIYAQ